MRRMPSDTERKMLRKSLQRKREGEACREKGVDGAARKLLLQRGDRVQVVKSEKGVLEKKGV